jgi:hypothetical protein
MAQPTPFDQIPIHLVVRDKGEDLRVDFTFDLATDDIDSLVADLGQSVDLTESNRPQVLRDVTLQVNKGREDQAGYRQLLENQKRELEQMDARHRREQEAKLRDLSGPAGDDLLLLF